MAAGYPPKFDGFSIGKYARPNLGHWIKENRRPNSYMFICSICERVAYDLNRNMDVCSLAYCPHCGNEMVKGDAEECD